MSQRVALCHRRNGWNQDCHLPTIGAGRVSSRRRMRSEFVANRWLAEQKEPVRIRRVRGNVPEWESTKTRLRQGQKRNWGRSAFWSITPESPRTEFSENVGGGLDGGDRHQF